MNARATTFCVMRWMHLATFFSIARSFLCVSRHPANALLSVCDFIAARNRPDRATFASHSAFPRHFRCQS